jgi:hypothetical protein
MAVVTVYRGARDPVPADAQDLAWPDLAREICALVNEPPGAPEGTSPEEQKKCLIAWAPHALAPGTKRALENVTHVSALVVDVDTGPTPEEITSRLYRAGFAGVVYESPSCTPERPKYRVVCPVVAPIAPGNCRETRLRFAAALGLAPDCGVKGAIDASKLFFVGRLHGTPERRAWIVEGQPVDTSALPPCPGPEWHTAPTTIAIAAHLADLPPADAGIAVALGPWTAHQGRKWQICGALGGLLRKLGYSAVQCESEIRAWLPADEPTVDVDAGVSWALGAWAKDTADVSGHEVLTQLLGVDHAAVVEAAAWAGTPYAHAITHAREVAARSPFAFVSAALAETGDPFDDAALITDFEGDDEPLEYLCPGLCITHLAGKINIVGGLPNAGKGPLADHLAICFATGRPVFGCMPCTPCNVLIVDFEGARLTKRRIKRMAKAAGVPWRDLRDRLAIKDASQLGDPRQPAFLGALVRVIKRRNIGVIVVDSYTSAMLCTDVDTRQNEFATFARALASVGVCVVAVAHARKPASGTKGETPTLADISGSGALGAMASTAVSCWKPDDADPYRVRVGCMRAPERGFETFEITFRDTADDGLALDFAGAQQVEARDAAEKIAKNAGETTQNTRRVLEIVRAKRELLANDIGASDVEGKPITGATLTAILGRLEAVKLVERYRGTRGMIVRLLDPYDVREINVEAGVVVFQAPTPPQ